MHLTRITTAMKHGFNGKKLHKEKDRPKQTSSYLKQKSSFFMAAFSLVAFVTGNMVGDHGWYAFWKAVVGHADDALIVYTGTVTPVALVPNYTKWSDYGGNADEHTFRQVPKDILIPLPAYDQAEAKKGLDGRGFYSVGNMGSYDTGAEGAGSHPGVDIRVPTGTPIRSIAAGIVTQVQNDAGGFGLFIVIRHPHVPDPENPKKTTVLHSNYAHLSAQLVQVGDLVEKGQQIGLSGQTGFATGPHLHFQVDRDSAPWHPYWPFTGTEARAAGLSTVQAINTAFHQERLKEHTVHPMLLVQADRAPVKETSGAVATTKPTKRKTAAELRAARKNERLARRNIAVVQQVAVAPIVSSASSSSVAPVVEVTTTSSAAAPVVVQEASSSSAATVGKIASFDLQYPRTYSGREWVTVTVSLLDESGRKASEETLDREIYLRTAYGEAEFNPAVLRKEDFKNGVASVKMLPRGQRTVVILLQPYAFQSGPIGYRE